MTTSYRPFAKRIPIIDAHAHMGAYRNFHIPDNDADGMLAQFDAVGIDVACVSHHASISADHVHGNEQVRRAVQRSPERLIGMCVLNPNYPETAEAEIERCFSGPGFRGFKAHPELHGDYPLDGPGYRPMWEYADHHGLPVLSHSYFGGDRLEVFRALSERYPNTVVLLGHAGIDLGLDRAAELANSSDNLVLDMTAMQRHGGAVEYLADRVGPTKLVWGSDSPFIDPGLVLGTIVHADIEDDVREAILYRNMASILGVDVHQGQLRSAG